MVVTIHVSIEISMLAQYARGLKVHHDKQGSYFSAATANLQALEPGLDPQLITYKKRLFAFLKAWRKKTQKSG